MKYLYSLRFLTVICLFSFCNECFCQSKHKVGKMHLQIDSMLTIQSGNTKLLKYQFNTVYPPAGIDTNFKRSGFIHPLYTPHGQVLTSIQPPDHYHHYGIWNPWTHTVFEKDTIDFWNLKKKNRYCPFC